MSGLENIANLALGKESILPGNPGQGGQAAAHPFLAVLDTVLTANPGQGEGEGRPPGQALRQIAAMAMGETALVPAGPARGVPTIEAAVEALAEEPMRAEDGTIDAEAIDRLLDRLLTQEPAISPTAQVAEGEAASAERSIEGASDRDPAAPSLEEVVLAAAAAMHSAGESRQNTSGRTGDAAGQTAEPRMPDRPPAMLRETAENMARLRQGNPHHHADARNGGDEQPEARRTADMARASGSDLTQRLRDGLVDRQANIDRSVPAQGQTPGQAQTQAQPEIVSSALSTVQDLGEDLSGRARIAMPNPGAGSAGYGADPAASNASSPVRAAIPALALEVASQARNGNRHFEIRLEPPELGRIEVRLEFARDGQMTTRMFVERPETLDMLMRDARGLEKALQANGVKVEDGAVQYQLRDQSAFGRHENAGRREDKQGSDHGSGDSQTDDHGDTPTPDADPWRRVGAAGLDVRV